MKPIFIYFICIVLFSSCNKAVTDNNYGTEIKNFREEKIKEFLTGQRSPLNTEEEVAMLDYFKADANYRVKAKLALATNEKPFELPTYSGITRTYILYGSLSFKVNKQHLKLNVYKNLSQPANPVYKNLLFLPFKDATNGESTYGGGRYINLSVNDIVNEELIVDFNKCYNPWCAYSEGFNCPIPPVENHLTIEILAGEKNYLGKHKSK